MRDALRLGDQGRLRVYGAQGSGQDGAVGNIPCLPCRDIQGPSQIHELILEALVTRFLISC